MNETNEQNLVKEFSDLMYKKIEVRHNRYVPFAWKSMDIKRLIKLLKGELDELEDSFNSGNDINIQEEAIDVANYAMFIHELSKCNHIKS